jgi:hypothetical protein
MLVFILLTMMMGGAILLSASLFYLNSSRATRTHHPKETQQRTNGVVFDDVELPQVRTEDEQNQAETTNVAEILDFTRTSHKSSKQLPLLGMPDKAFYHIH